MARNRNLQIRGIMDFLRNPCALPSQEERVATVVGDLGIGVIRVASQQEQPAVSCLKASQEEWRVTWASAA